MEHCTSANEKAKPGMPDAGLPGLWPWLSSLLILGVEDDPQPSGKQAEMAQQQVMSKELKLRWVKAQHCRARLQA